jgi:hypothetical protein
MSNWRFRRKKRLIGIRKTKKSNKETEKDRKEEETDSIEANTHKSRKILPKNLNNCWTSTSQNHSSKSSSQKISIQKYNSSMKIA